MADDPKAAGGEGAAVEAKPELSAEPKDTTPQETPEQERDRLRKEVEAHRKTQAEWQPQIEDYKRLKATGVTTPPTSAPVHQADPLVERIQRLQAQAQQYPDDPTVAEALETAALKYHARERQRAIEAGEAHLSAMPENIRDKARQYWMGGTPLPTARAMAERDAALDAERDQLAKEREQLEKDRKARTEGRQSLGSRPVLGPDKPSGEGPQRVPQSKWDHLDDLPEEERLTWLRRYNAGLVEVVRD